MADNDSRLPPDCDCDALSFPASDDSQLELAFPVQDGAGAVAPLLPKAGARGFLGRHARHVPAPATRRRDELDLEHDLTALLPPGKVLELRLTENRYTIISVERGRQRYRVRVHRMFAGVEPRLLRALARYIVHNDLRASRLLSEFIERHQDQIRLSPRRTRRVVLRTRGRVHDLKAVYDRLNGRYFAGKLDLCITWGAARRRPAQRSIKVGAFLVEDRLIRVHPVLDQEMVPDYFLDWIVFHEMLHGKHAIRRVRGRRCFHPPELLREERQFPDYGRARVWEKANLDRLLG